MTFAIEIRHNFETAHRLSWEQAPKKCQSIHGHSWWVTLVIASDSLDEHGMLIEFGALKKHWRGFLDSHVDHHLVLHCDDPMIDAIRGVQPDARLLILDFQPTTEALSKWLHGEAVRIVDSLGYKDVTIAKLHLQETAVNAASYSLS